MADVFIQQLFILLVLLKVLFNKLNNIRAKKGEKLLNYTNFQNMINQNNKSVLYQDLDELCDALECEISDLLTREPTDI